MKYLTIFLFIFTSKNAFAQGPTTLSSCPNVNPVENKNVDDVCKGRWYVLKVYSSPSPPHPQTCIVMESSPTDDPTKFKINNMGKSNGMISNVTTIVTVESPGIIVFDGDLEAPDPTGGMKKIHTYVKVLLKTFQLLSQTNRSFFPARCC